jgi:acetyltransferase
VSAPSAGPPPTHGPTRGRYPSELERTWTPAGRPAVRIRPLRPGDIDLELAFVAGLSRETLHLRLQYSATQVDRQELERLLDLDYFDRLAVAGLIDTDGVERIVGVSRYARVDDTDRAECAIVVADDWQGCGLGTELMRSLIDAALARGYHFLEGETLAENARLVNWARRFGFNVRTQPNSGGLVRVTLELDGLSSAT